MTYIKYGPGEEIRIMTIPLSLKADGVKDQISAHNEYRKIHGLKSHSLRKRMSLGLFLEMKMREESVHLKKKKTQKKPLTFTP